MANHKWVSAPACFSSNGVFKKSRCRGRPAERRRRLQVHGITGCDLKDFLKQCCSFLHQRKRNKTRTNNSKRRNNPLKKPSKNIKNKTTDIFDSLKCQKSATFTDMINVWAVWYPTLATRWRKFRSVTPLVDDYPRPHLNTDSTAAAQSDTCMQEKRQVISKTQV